MPLVSQSPKTIFHILKSAVASRSDSSSSTVRAVMGQEESSTVVDSFSAKVPGSMFNMESPTSVIIEATSTVDNRPETNDEIFFSTNKDNYLVQEQRYVDGDGGVVQAQYPLSRWDGKDWQPIGQLA